MLLAIGVFLRRRKGVGMEFLDLDPLKGCYEGISIIGYEFRFIPMV